MCLFVFVCVSICVSVIITVLLFYKFPNQENGAINCVTAVVDFLMIRAETSNFE